MKASHIFLVIFAIFCTLLLPFVPPTAEYIKLIGGLIGLVLSFVFLQIAYSEINHPSHPAFEIWLIIFALCGWLSLTLVLLTDSLAVILSKF